MSNEVRGLEPKALWNFFEDLNAVPRPSKKEERVIQFIVDFGHSLNLETVVDKVGNVRMRKPATLNMENRKMVTLQSHLDMVHQKNASTDFDFLTQGIQSYIDGDWVKAKGTTLGADNGLGVASIMTLLASDDIPHPPLEALFTIDEETGMTGAKGLEPGFLDGEILLNLDTEDDDELSIGCAGGIDTLVNMDYPEVTLPSEAKGLRIAVNGLKGGHSGMDIHLGRGNANKIMNRLLFETTQTFGVHIVEIDGGSLRNAIPRESFATIAVNNLAGLEKHLDKVSGEIKAELHSAEPNLKIEWNSCDVGSKGMDALAQDQVLAALYAMPNGVYRMSADIPDLVETSSNLARVIIKDGHFNMQSLQRSSVDTAKTDMASAIRATFNLIGAKVVHEGSYPGWTPDPDSSILNIMADLYRELNNEEPNILACHAGLECGLLGTHYPEMEMISFGPNIRNPHSPDEMTQISSVQKYWNLLLETLQRIPVKA
jgi:dipeptidase D